jgi:hypothetical protein
MISADIKCIKFLRTKYMELSNIESGNQDNEFENLRGEKNIHWLGLNIQGGNKDRNL